MGHPFRGALFCFGASARHRSGYHEVTMRSERPSAASGTLIALSVLVALLVGMVALLEGHVGGRRAAMAWVIGVYLAGGVFFGGIQGHFSLRSWPRALWEPGDGKKLVRRSLIAFCFWPLGI